MEENNTGDWCAPADFIMDLPEIQIQRGGILWPMPSLSAIIIPKSRKRWYWWPKTVWYVVVRQYGKDEEFYAGPFERFEYAKRVHQEFYAWYTTVYNVIIRTYKATERNKK